MYYPVLASLLSELHRSNITYRWEHGIQIVRGRYAIGRDIGPELCQGEGQSTERSSGSGATGSRPAAENRQRVPDLFAVQIRRGACDNDTDERHECEAKWL